MASAVGGFARLDTHKRVNLNKYTSLGTGDFYEVHGGEDGVLTLTPRPIAQLAPNVTSLPTAQAVAA